jgi:plastocyanin
MVADPGDPYRFGGHARRLVNGRGSMRKILLVMVAVLALVGAACSSGDDNGGCTEANAVDLSGDDPFVVTTQNFGFDPPCFKASSASSITIDNKDAEPHTFTIDGTQVDATIDGGQTFNGESPSLAPGSYDFYCKIHPTMTGTVIVV